MMIYDPQDMHIEIMKQNPRKAGYKGGDFAQWQKNAREKLWELLGMDELIKCAPDLQIEFTKQQDGFTETRFNFLVEPKMRIVAHLWVPDGATKPLPLVICLQGHSKGMNISMGRPYDDKPIVGDRDFAVYAVKLGYAVLSMDQRCFGQCGGTDDGPNCYIPTMAALLIGRTTIGERVWDIMRVIDVITDNFSDVIDLEKILLMGNSGGGTATIYAAALETRISAAMPSCAFCGYMESIGVQRHCTCNHIPHIAKYFDMGDLGGMIAPRPLVVINGKLDYSFPLESAQREFGVTKTYYELSGKPDNCRHVIGEEGHRFYADIGWGAMHELGFPYNMK
ncbi:MAG: acetylxylan esterase [Clostridia bacterium]|nr:acetylxylan esterase [Clostridia bacterium]